MLFLLFVVEPSFLCEDVCSVAVGFFNLSIGDYTAVAIGEEMRPTVDTALVVVWVGHLYIFLIESHATTQVVVSFNLLVADL